MTLEDVYHTLQQQDMIHIRENAASPRPLPGQSIRFVKGRKSSIARKALHRNSTRDDDSLKGPFISPTSYEISWDREAVSSYLAKWKSKGLLALKPENLKWSPFLVARTLKSDGMLEDTLPSAMESATPTTPGLGTRSSVLGGSRTESPAFALFDDDEDNDGKQSVSDVLPVLRSRGKQRKKSVSSSAMQFSPDSDDTPRRLTRRRTSSNVEPVTPTQHPTSMRRTRSAVKLPSFQHDEAMIAEDAALAAKLAMEDRPRRMLRSRSNTNSVPDKRALSPRAMSSSVSPKKRRRVDPDTPPARNTRSQGPLPNPRRPSNLVRRRSSMRSQASTVGSTRKSRPSKKSSHVLLENLATSPLSRSSPPPDTPSPISTSHPTLEDEEGRDEEDAVAAQLETAEPESRPEPERDRNEDKELKDEERDTPLTTMTSRHSVGHSDDTVCAADDQTVKVIPQVNALTVVSVPVSVDSGGKTERDEVKTGPGVLAIANAPASGIGNDSDVDAEGEEDPDAEGEPYAEEDLDADAEGEEDLDAEGEPDLEGDEVVVEAVSVVA